MSRETILIIDDEIEIVELIGLYLRKEGFRILTATTGKDALKLMEQHAPSLIILDLLLPDMDGIEICRQLRETCTVPILFISCIKEEMDIILSFSMGGDDYMTKPFSPKQLVARVKAHLRRSRINCTAADPSLLLYAGLELDLLNRTVRVHGKSVVLSSKEFELLTHLAKHPNKTIPSEQLYQMAWGLESNGDLRTLLVHISNLRKKIEVNPSMPQYVQTVRGIGYRFASP